MSWELCNTWLSNLWLFRPIEFKLMKFDSTSICFQPVYSLSIIILIPFCPCVYHWVFCIFQGSESFSSSMKAAGLPELPPGMVHPAFLHPMMRPSVPIPQSGYFPIPLQLQQLYQAQLRASAAYDGLLQRDHASFSGVPLPMFVPQMPLYSQRDKKWPAVQSLSTILYSYLIWSLGYLNAIIGVYF